MKRILAVSARLAAVPATIVLLGSTPLQAAVPWSDTQLVQLLDELVAYVDAHPVVREPAAVTCGMNCEFGDPEMGRKLQAFGPDTMHDRASFAGGLRTVETWHAISKAKGCLPAAFVPAGRAPGTRDVSENGGYARLIRTIVMIRIDRAGNSEWQRIAQRSPQAPIEVSLPESVLRAQEVKRGSHRPCSG
jgi:hypothetical protein